MKHLKSNSANFAKCVFVMVFMLMGSCCLLHAKDRTKSEVEHAVRVLKGIDSDCSKDWAVAVLSNAATSDTMAYAMNCLGLAYLSGTGVGKDTIKAVDWLEKAGASGYSLAFHNLGMLYKEGKYGVKQDFCKAFDAFSKGAKTESVICKYECGFMLYKGLGCLQDYGKSVLLFEDGANKNYSPSLYMLGLCYRNGYGVERDTVRANILLKHSASLGYTPAIEELRRPIPENYLFDEFYNSENLGNVPITMPTIQPDLNDINLVNGSYQGCLVMYDWSGKFVLGEKPIKMTFIPKYEGELQGELILANDTIPFRATLSDNGKMKFSSGNLRLNERYTVGKKVNYRMDEAMLDIWKNKICGSLKLYSLKVKEPERPMYVELIQSDTQSHVDIENSHISVTPNPFSYEFAAKFVLAEECDVVVRIFDQFGILVYSQDLGILSSGKHQTSIVPNVQDGWYVLNIKAGRQMLRTIIVKKGGGR